MSAEPEQLSAAEIFRRRIDDANDALIERNKLIRAEYREGGTSYAKLGDKYGLSPTRVKAILGQQEPDESGGDGAT
jgi:hypothetical protein